MSLGVLYDDVTNEDWQLFADALEENTDFHLRFFRYDSETKRISIIELPSLGHDRTSRWFSDQFAVQGHGDYLDSDGSSRAKSIHKEPDESWTPIGRPRVAPGGGGGGARDATGRPFPTVVLEVGRTQTLEDLRRDALEWLSDPSTVQIVILIKLIDRKDPGPANDPTHPLPEGPAVDMNMEIYFREDLIDEGPGELGAPREGFQKYFGNYGTHHRRPPPDCTGPNLPNYLVTIPGRCIYHGDPILTNDPLPNPVQNGVTLDLFRLQQTILRSWEE
jgi:hypothetical protein